VVVTCFQPWKFDNNSTSIATYKSNCQTKQSRYLKSHPQLQSSQHHVHTPTTKRPHHQRSRRMLLSSLPPAPYFFYFNPPLRSPPLFLYLLSFLLSISLPTPLFSSSSLSQPFHHPVPSFFPPHQSTTPTNPKPNLNTLPPTPIQTRLY
jgi:hypothetical protein